MINEQVFRKNPRYDCIRRKTDFFTRVRYLLCIEKRLGHLVVRLLYGKNSLSQYEKRNGSAHSLNIDSNSVFRKKTELCPLLSGIDVQMRLASLRHEDKHFRKPIRF